MKLNYFPDTDSLYIDLSHKQSTGSQALAAPSTRPPPPKYSAAFSAVVDSRSEQRPVVLPVSGRVSEANQWHLRITPPTRQARPGTLSTRGYCSKTKPIKSAAYVTARTRTNIVTDAIARMATSAKSFRGQPVRSDRRD